MSQIDSTAKADVAAVRRGRAVRRRAKRRRWRLCFFTPPLGHAYRSTDDGRECVGCGKRQRFVCDGGGCGWETVR